MPTALEINYRPMIDLQNWRFDAVMQSAHAAGASLAWDHRNNANGSPFIYALFTASNFQAYDPAVAESVLLQSPSLGASGVAAGSAIKFFPSQGPRGVLAAGNTTTSVVISTALPAAVGVNSLANRGDGVGFVIRIIGNAAGSSGKVEERRIVANTGGTTPTITLDAPLTFTPATGDGYELRAGRVYLLGAGTLAAGIFKHYDIATNSYSGNLATANLPATIGIDSNMVALSEAHVPWNRSPGEGFVSGAGAADGKNCIVATASAATTITGSGMPAALAANEYRNFQVRVVEDTTTPTAVNQRRRIASHTGGANAVFTVAAWAVTPSATAKFVIENDDDKLLMRSSATTAVYNYNIAANTWDTTTWAAAPAAHGAGVWFEQAFGIEPDAQRNARHSQLFCIRGGNSAVIDVLDIAGAATGAWSGDIVYGKRGGALFNAGTTAAYDPATNGGRLAHINLSGTQRMLRFDMKNRILDVNTPLDFAQGTALVGQRIANAVYIDPVNPAIKQNFVVMLGSSQANVYSLPTM